MWVQLGDVYDQLEVGVEIDYYGNFPKPPDGHIGRGIPYSIYRIECDNFWLLRGNDNPIYCEKYMYRNAWIRFVKISSCDIISEICFTGSTSDANLKFLIDEILKC